MENKSIMMQNFNELNRKDSSESVDVNRWVQWSSGRVSDSLLRVAGSTHTRSTAINLEQVANMLCV